MIYDFKAKLWLYSGENPWVFATVPKDISDEIEYLSKDFRRGFGAVRVKVKIDEETWKTSVFPDKKSSCYIIPIKKDIRTTTGLRVGDSVKISIEIFA